MALKLGLVVDSTFDLPLEFYEENNVKMVPLRVIFGTEEVYKEHIELSSEDFYEKLITSPKIPTTSQPPVGEFIEVYEELLKENHVILSLHLPGTLSGTMQSAQLAAKEVDGEIIVMDTCSVSVGSAQILKSVLKNRDRFSSKDEIVSFINDLRENQKLIGVLPTLEYLEKGGRIGRAQALIANLLDFKPLLHIDKDGVVAPLGRARGMKKAFRDILDFISEFAGNEPIRLSFAYCKETENTEKFRSFLIESGLKFEDAGIHQVGPVIGTYLGPEVVMISVLRIKDGF